MIDPESSWSESETQCMTITIKSSTLLQEEATKSYNIKLRVVANEQKIVPMEGHEIDY